MTIKKNCCDFGNNISVFWETFQKFEVSSAVSITHWKIQKCTQISFCPKTVSKLWISWCNCAVFIQTPKNAKPSLEKYLHLQSFCKSGGELFKFNCHPLYFESTVCLWRIQGQVQLQTFEICFAHLNCFPTTLVLYWRLSGDRINSKMYSLYIVGTILEVPVCYEYLNYRFIFQMRISVCPQKYKFQIHKCLQNTLHENVIVLWRQLCI